MKRAMKYCFDSSPARSLCWDDLEVGKLLGSGSFATVYRVKLQSGLDQEQNAFVDPGQSFCASDELGCSSRTFSTERSYSNDSLMVDQGRLCALKVLNENIIVEQDCATSRRSQAAIKGLKFEAQLLSELPRHEHIIHLIGLSSDLLLGDPTSSSPQGLFLVLERLTETLDQRLRRWKTRKAVEQNGTSMLRRIVTLRGGKDPEQSIRVQHIGLGIASAMLFLHRHHVVYRDLKPNNIGFDSQGTVKLFDFGLARKLDKESRENRKLTMQVGTFRYMSPEAYFGSATSCDGVPPYSYSTDVYSFAILLWEIVTLKKPFGKIRTLHDLTKTVVLQCRRPNLGLVHSRQVRQLLKTSWDPDPDLRPSFAPIVAQLQKKKQAQGNMIRASIKESKACPAA